MTAPGDVPSNPIRFHRPAGRVIAAAILILPGLALSAFRLTSEPVGPDLFRPIVVAVLGMVLTGVGAVLMARHLCRTLGGPLYARLGPAFACYFTVVFGVFGLAWLSRTPQTGSAGVIDPAQVPSAIALTAIALAAWIMGQCVGSPRGIVAMARRTLRGAFPNGPWSLRFASLPVFLYLIGLLARGIRLRSGRFGYLGDGAAALAAPSAQSQLLGTIENLCRFGLLLAALDAFALSRSLRSRAVLGVLLLSEVVLGLFAGSKEAVILTVAAVGLVYVFGRGAIPGWAKILGVFVLLVVFPINQDYRDSLRDRPGAVASTTAVDQLQQVLGDTFTSLTPRTVLIDSPARLARRLREIDNVALVRQKTPELIPYVGWEELAYGPLVGVVPRALWTDKPVLTQGRSFAQDYYELPDTLYSASAVTVPGDLYRHGGVVPVVLGMVLLGFLMRLVDVVADPRRDLRLLVVYVPAFSILIKSESSFNVLIVALIQTVLVACLVGRLAFVARPPSSSSAGADDSNRLMDRVFTDSHDGAFEKGK